MKTRYLITAICYDKQSKLLSVADNHYTKSHPLQKHFAVLAGYPNKIYLHAEILAMIRGMANSTDNKLHTINVMQWKNGKYALAKPCKVCLTAMIAFGIKKVNYTTPEGWVYGKTPEEILEEHKRNSLSTKDK